MAAAHLNIQAIGPNLQFGTHDIPLKHANRCVVDLAHRTITVHFNRACLKIALQFQPQNLADLNRCIAAILRANDQIRPKIGTIVQVLPTTSDRARLQLTFQSQEEATCFDQHLGTQLFPPAEFTVHSTDSEISAAASQTESVAAQVYRIKDIFDRIYRSTTHSEMFSLIHDPRFVQARFFPLTQPIPTHTIDPVQPLPKEVQTCLIDPCFRKEDSN